MNSHLPSNHPKIGNKIGVLILNLGTPDGYSYFAVRRYLKQFLMDKRVIEVNSFLWVLILYLFILPFRPFTTGQKYQKIWMKDINYSPLKYYTSSQAKKLQELVDKTRNHIIVDYSMRYANPSIKSKISELIKKRCTKILFIPLYPQYCAATTATMSDEIQRTLQKVRWQPETRVVGQYSDNKVYIQALVNSVKKHTKSIDFIPDAILSSYHGIPKAYFDKGDPYPCFCYKTNRLFNEELKKQNIRLKSYISFQSRFGPKDWIQPYTSDVLRELIRKKIKNLIVITPGFMSDCVETLEEVGIEYKNLFLKLGGANFSLVPCLNDSDDAIKLITHLMNYNLWKKSP